MIDLSLFCADTEDPRQYLHKPFSFGAFTCASNGHIAIIVERRAEADELIWTKWFPRYLSYLREIIQKRGQETGLVRMESIDINLSSHFTGGMRLAQIGAANFQTRYLLLAKTLPNAHLHAFSETDAGLIMFDGGFGVLMHCLPFNNFNQSKRHT